VQLADNYGGNNGPLSSSQIGSEAPYYNTVWAAFEPGTWTSDHGSGTPMILSLYSTPFEDMNLVSGNTLAYFQQNHPSWLLYGCAKDGTPTTDLAWSGTGFSDVPLNIDNPDVRNFEVTELVNYMASHGYNALAVDQVVFENFLLSPNPILENGKEPVSGSYGCGTYATYPPNNNFTRVFGSASGGELYNTNDQTFNNDIIQWLAAAKTALNANGFHLLVNHPPSGSAPNTLEQQMLQYADGEVVENGFTNYGAYITSGLPGLFTQTLSYAQTLQSQYKKAVFLTYYYGGSSSAGASSLSGAQVDWALATYALANLGGADAYIVPEGVDEYSYRGEYANDNYGAACGSMTQSGSVYMQQFQHGLAIVNAGYSTQSVTLPAGISYTDIENRAAINSPMQVGSADGWMLLTSGNGCGSSSSSVIRHRP